MLQNNVTPLFPAESKTYQEYEDRVIVSCGEASIILHKDGRIELKGTAFIQTAESIELNARRVDICP